MDISADKIFSKIDENLELIAGVFQLTHKDIWGSTGQANYFGSLDLEGKLKYVADVVLGRTLGMNPFPEVSGTFPATFKLGNAINRTSEVGVLLWGLSEVGFLSSKWGTRGKKIAVGGAIGGMFDAPGNGNSRSIDTSRRMLIAAQMGA